MLYTLVSDVSGRRHLRSVTVSHRRLSTFGVEPSPLLVRRPGTHFLTTSGIDTKHLQFSVLRCKLHYSRSNVYSALEASCDRVLYELIFDVDIDSDNDSVLGSTFNCHHVRTNRAKPVFTQYLFPCIKS